LDGLIWWFFLRRPKASSIWSIMVDPVDLQAAQDTFRFTVIP